MPFYVAKSIRCSPEKIHEKKMETKTFEIYKERKEKSTGGGVKTLNNIYLTDPPGRAFTCVLTFTI